MVATGVQSWRLRTLYQKIGRVLDGKGSVVFLKKSDGTSDGESLCTCLFVFQEVE